MSNEQRNTVWRFAIIFILILIGFVAVIGRIIYIQTAERDEWLRCAELQEPVYDTIPALRGNIIDCNGNFLATSMPQYTMIFDSRAEALRADSGRLFHKYVDTLAYDLSRILQYHTQAEYKEMLKKAWKQGSREYKLCLTVNYLQRKQLAENPLIKRGRNVSGISYKDRNVRSKPYGILASRTIGEIYADKGIGRSGLEMGFEKELHGVNGLMRVEKIGLRYESITVQEAQDGMDIITTIDANLQDIVEKALLEKVKEKNANWGCCILMETQTGYIRAIANIDHVGNGVYKEDLNHAARRVEPGSTFKTLALMAMMNDGKVGLKDTVSASKKSWWYPGEHIKGAVEHTDTHARDTVHSVRSALAASSNIAFAKLVTRSYNGSATKFIQALQRLGIPDDIYSEIPAYEKPRIDRPKDTVTVSKMAYGYSVELSPLTIAMYYNAIANNGKMMRPMLVTAIQQNGKDIQTFNPVVVNKSVTSKKVIQDLKLALHDVVWDNKLGTASVNKYKQRKAQSDIVSIAGKTGTAQLLTKQPNGKWKYSETHHRMTFVGYFPEEDPQYTCLCMIEDPKPAYTYDAGMDCGSTVRTIAEKVMAYTGCYVYEKGERKLEKR